MSKTLEANRPKEHSSVEIRSEDGAQAIRLLGSAVQDLDQLNLLVKYIPAAVAVFDRELRYIAVSDRWASDYHLNRSAILGQHHYHIFPEIRTMPHWVEIHERNLKGETLKCERDPFPREDGSVDYVRWENVPWYQKDGSIGGIIMFTEVITEQVIASDDLRRSASLLETFLASAARPDLPLKEQIENALSHSCLTLGAELGIISRIQGSEYFVEYVWGPGFDINPGDVFPLGDVLCSRVVESRSMVFLSDLEQEGLGDHPARRNLGIVSYIGSPLLVRGQLYGTINYSTTKRVRWAETQAERNYLELIGRWLGAAYTKAWFENELDHSMTQLVDANDLLEKRNRALQEFSAMVSHDLKQPLINIAGFAELLAFGLPENTDETSYDIVDRIARSARGALQLVHDVLDFCRAGTGTIESSTVSLDQLLDEVRRALEPEMRRKDVTLIVPELPFVNGDAPMLRQLFSNLVSNALRYHGSDPIVIEVTVDSNDSEWILGVRDNGLGVPEEISESIFEPFERGESQEYIAGSGVGLTICKRIVDRHQGRIWVENNSDQPGSHFRFSLPRVDHKASE